MDDFEFDFGVGDRIEHKRDSNLTGKIVHIDYGYITFGATTCEVQWDYVEEGDIDIQWTNKLVKI